MSAARCPCGRASASDYTADQCYLCWLPRNVPAYADAWGFPPVAVARPPLSGGRPRGTEQKPACAHRGDELTGPERAAAGVGHARRWFRCGLGLSVGGSPPGVVCACKGCGPRCPSYTPGAD